MEPVAHRLRILVVDDDDISRAVLHEHLDAAGHTVLLAADGPSAMAILQREPVQIVVADWIMPNVSGLDLCRWLRRQHFKQSPHFVMLTVLSDKEKLIEAFGAGVDDFLSKPLYEGELLARLRAWTRIVSLQEQLALRHADVLRANDELVSLNAKLADLAIRDELTGLPNRREAVRRLAEQWAFSVRYGHPLACAIIDVDNFKAVNDTCGHLVGDKVLQQIALQLQGCLRDTDGIFRVGGDEFLVLLPGLRVEDAATWAQRCRQAVRNVSALAETRLTQTISIGVTERQPQMSDWRELVNAADQALLAGKRCGRDCVRWSALN